MGGTTVQCDQQSSRPLASSTWLTLGWLRLVELLPAMNSNASKFLLDATGWSLLDLQEIALLGKDSYS